MSKESEASAGSIVRTPPPLPRPRRKPRSPRSTPLRYSRPSSPRRGATSRLVLASNRLPVQLARSPEGEWSAYPASGGLVTALRPVIRARGGVWIGWPGAPDAGEAELRRAVTLGDADGLDALPRLHAIRLTESERDRFYQGYSNGVLWPVLHGLPEYCAPAPGQWEAYERVNRRFARALDRAVRPGDLTWVHDYHLMLVGRELKRLRSRSRLAFFLHTPFPRPEVFERVAEHRAIVRALMEFDLLGFQNVRDRDSFVETAKGLLQDGANGIEERVGAFPISIDVDEFERGGEDSEVAARAREIRRTLGKRTLYLGVDRLDYTKGIPERLRALDHALDHHPQLREQIVLRQLVVPSRDSLSTYARTRAEIERSVERINRKWGTADWQPVEYEYASWNRTELLAHYRVADVALVTPVNDGMNLVAKEYCAANDGRGVLVLSAFAGAAAELGQGALLVNPADASMTAAAILAAHTMAIGERRHRMEVLKRAVRGNDVHRWVETFLARAGRTEGDAQSELSPG